MTQWEDLNIQNKVEMILAQVPTLDPDHHFGQPFITAYQIAIGFARDYPDEYQQLNLPVGGKDTGQHHSLAQYLARELSGRIRNGYIQNIEGRFISNLYITDMTFEDQAGATVHSSISGNQASLSIYRLTASA